MKFLTNLFQPTVAGALDEFKKAAAKLERVAAHHSDIHAREFAARDQAHQRALAAQSEAVEATRLRSKFSEIFGV